MDPKYEHTIILLVSLRITIAISSAKNYKK